MKRTVKRTVDWLRPVIQQKTTDQVLSWDQVPKGRLGPYSVFGTARLSLHLGGLSSLPQEVLLGHEAVKPPTSHSPSALKWHGEASLLRLLVWCLAHPTGSDHLQLGD